MSAMGGKQAESRIQEPSESARPTPVKPLDPSPPAAATVVRGHAELDIYDPCDQRRGYDGAAVRSGRHSHCQPAAGDLGWAHLAQTADLRAWVRRDV